MVSVMFVDIRGFTGFADRSTAREAVDLLNEFFELAIPVLGRHGGHAHKLLGDGLLGVFGAPEALPDHARQRACRRNRHAGGGRGRFGERLRIGIGINSGLVLVGKSAGATWSSWESSATPWTWPPACRTRRANCASRSCSPRPPA